jgi:hypothetical protein
MLWLLRSHTKGEPTTPEDIPSREEAGVRRRTRGTAHGLAAE